MTQDEAIGLLLYKSPRNYNPRELVTTVPLLSMGDVKNLLNFQEELNSKIQGLKDNTYEIKYGSIYIDTNEEPPALTIEVFRCETAEEVQRRKDYDQACLENKIKAEQFLLRSLLEKYPEFKQSCNRSPDEKEKEKGSDLLSCQCGVQKQCMCGGASGPPS